MKIKKIWLAISIVAAVMLAAALSTAVLRTVIQTGVAKSVNWSTYELR